ncbi:hypothetical protein LDL08_15450 [Nonomuraea glycinis]|uniref:Uncharacterized protein n=1 Tax=Nonomuraea glycinis TaxID=2047744 RepID=A0A918AFC6_9ACTN|nr:hypothetical protein [Nonomuraea glycinis]MCA2177582.1 hypothetical protein [Nonomuraea glycinis]GGP17533.1 hypothetical protein GCM10012278_86350 [Nonomuraea glycinis]
MQEIAKVAPAGAHVVKAFNTVFGHMLAQGNPLDVLIAGDDAAAKATVSARDQRRLRSLQESEKSLLCRAW